MGIIIDHEKGVKTRVAGKPNFVPHRVGDLTGRKKKKGLRLCMVTTFYPPYNFGGDGIGVQRLSAALVRRGHEVCVLQDVDPYFLLNKGQQPLNETVEDGVEVVRLHNTHPTLSVLLTQQTGRPIANSRAIKDFFHARQFDVINYHNISLVGGPGILSYGDALKLYMAHEHWLVCPTHVLWRHGKELCEARECVRCALSYRRPPQMWRSTGFLERQLKLVDTFIAMSEFSRRKHQEFGFTREMEVVNYFLPKKSVHSKQKQKNTTQERPYFLFVGRLERIKGLDDVIPAFKHYQEADLLIAGEGEHAGALRELARDIPNVKFLGPVAPEELEAYYAQALALIVPSVCYETFGIILIEAFRQSTPVIARRIGPFPEIVNASGGGMLFEESHDLLLAMRKIQSQPELRAKLAKSAYRGYLEHWSEDAVVPRYLRVIERTAEAKGRMDIVEALHG